MTSTLSRATILKYVLHFFLWGPAAFSVAGSTCPTGLLAPGGLVDNDHKREALRVRFTADGEADASEGGEGGGGEGGEGGGGRGVMEAGDKFFLKRGLMKRGLVISFFWKH